MRDSGGHTSDDHDSGTRDGLDDDHAVDELLSAAAPGVVTASPGIDAEVRRLALAHGVRRRSGSVGRGIAAAVVLVGVALGGAAVGAATAAPTAGTGARPQPPAERTIAMSKTLESGTCDLAWTVTVRKHVDGYLQQLDDAAAYLTTLDVARVDPDPQWLEALNASDSVAIPPQRSPLEKEGNAFMMAVVKSAWTDGGVSDEVIALETITVCTEATDR